MSKEKNSNLIFSVNKTDKIGYKEIHIGYEENGEYQEYYSFKGVFNYHILNPNTVAIIEIENENEVIRPRITMFMRKSNGHNIDTIPLFGISPKISPEMNEIGKLIITSPSDRVYSFELGGFVSAEYSQIDYDAATQTFLVKYLKSVLDKTVTLQGELDQDGHLIDDTLYLPALRTSYVVDEHNLHASIDALVPQIEKDLTKEYKRLEQRQLMSYEYELYATRKRQKKS